MKLKYLLLLNVLMVISPLAGSLPGLKQEKNEAPQISVQEKQLQAIDKELAELNELHKRSKLQLDGIVAEIAVLKDKAERAQGEQAEYLLQRLSLYNQIQQAVTEKLQEESQYRSYLDQRANLIKDQGADTEFAQARIPKKTIPDFDDLQDLLARRGELRDQISQLEKNKMSAANDLARRKKAFTAINDNYKEHLKQQEVLLEQQRENPAWSAREKGQLFDDETRLILAKKELAELKVRAGEARLALIEVQLEQARTKEAVVEKDYHRLKRTLIVDTSYLKKVEAKLENSRQTYQERRDRIHEKINLLAPLRQDFKKRLEKAEKSYEGIGASLNLLENWTFEPKSAQDWHYLCRIGALAAQEKFVDVEQEFLEAHTDLERAKFYAEELTMHIVRTWHKMTTKKFRGDSTAEIDQEIKQYEIAKTELQVDISVLMERRTNALNLLPVLNTLLDRIKNHAKTLKEQRTQVFKDNQQSYNDCMRMLLGAEDQVRRRIDLLAKLVDVYSTTIATMTGSLKKNESIIAELGTKGLWQRSAQAIEWSELKHFIPDLKRFMVDVQETAVTYFSISHLGSMLYKVLYLLTSPGFFILLLLRLLIIVVLLLLLRLYIPDFRDYLLNINPNYGILSTLSSFMATLLGFVSNHLVALYCWLVLFFIIKTEMIADSFLAILFYLVSIPYLIFMSYRFIEYVLQVSGRRGYAHISQQYQIRFSWIIAPLIYAAIILYFSREAFLHGNYPTSHVPIILLALIFILLQIALLSMIGKEQILSLIPTTTPLWELVESYVDKYYYIILAGIISIIVMSNPYVGYSRQVFYILSRLLLTILLIPLFSWFHNRIKRVSSDLFFYYGENEVVKERFAAAKSWYSIFVVATFLLFVLLGGVIIGYLWGYVITPHELSKLLEYRLYTPGVDETTGKVIEVTLLSLFKIVIFMLAGVVVTYVVNHFILQRIFDPLLIGAGVQNTVLTLTRYIIVIIALFMGMQHAGLDAMTTKLVVLIGLLSYYFKETVTDVFAYFIILIQRPIKIGDLVMLDTGVRGVVRQITPRSTIIRRDNSVTLVVPNSHILSKTVINWNYIRTFFAFDDFFVTVPYGVDPLRVRQIILQVLDSNINVLKNPAPIVRLFDFTDNGFQFQVRGYLTADKVLEQWDIASNIRLEIVRHLRQEGISIASPTRILTMVNNNS